MLQATQPPLDDRRLDGAEFAATQLRHCVLADAKLGRFPDGLGEGLSLKPALGEVGERDFASVGIDVHPAEHVGGNAGKAPLCVLLAGEHLRSLVSVGIAVPGSPPASLAVPVGANSLSIADGLPPV